MRTFLTHASSAFEVLVNTATMEGEVVFPHSRTRHVGAAVRLGDHVYVTTASQQFVARQGDAHFYR